ncbi:hypothetical protein [[Clostridium] fimetarium]|uniref:Uncharacterized protein n=1 Tax=[Clostridium] fimetarium TaxID=99656 RepID=A0A1I0QGJ6_9FIRM|nr:hypothetical protein [[Clostridium] fimetarium]SEW26240.1 hypothetical protein SAMN05421659_1087 [[Clostridium] fimetarium]
MSLRLKELRKLPDEELVELYDQTANYTSVGLNYYAEELNRRSNENTNKIMIRSTIWITIMTGVMLIATLVNIVILTLAK